MARARNIKPGFFANEDLAELPFSTRLLFIGLWTLADREGRLEDRPKRIKMAIFPADNVEVEDGLAELARFGFIERYEVKGLRIIAITAWHKHQAPHHTEKASELPDKNGEVTVKAPLDNGDKPVKSRKDNGGNPPDSLIPDSLIPEEEQPVRAKRSPPPACPEDVDAQVWSDWVAHRKAKRATVTETVISEARSEAVKAGLTFEAFLRVWCRRGTQGLEAAWLKPEERGRAPPGMTPREQRQAETVRAWMGSAYQPNNEDGYAPPIAIR